MVRAVGAVRVMNSFFTSRSFFLPVLSLVFFDWALGSLQTPFENERVLGPRLDLTFFLAWWPSNDGPFPTGL